ncbi:MAG: YceI family protein [Gemmatimonadales bacterium]
MRRLLLCALALLVVTGPLAAQPRVPRIYSVDDAHSFLGFSVRLAGFNRVRGLFQDWRADFSFDPARPLDGIVHFWADASTIATGVTDRDEHLRTADFFDVARYPSLTFEGRVVAAAGSRLELEGALTIRGQTRTVRFPAELLTPETEDPFGNRRIAFGAELSINRRDFEIHGPRFWSTAISESVTIELEVGGRIWDYRSVNYGRATAYYGPTLVAASDSGRFAPTLATLRGELAAEADTARLPRPFETEVAVGRLVQGGHLDQALAVLTLFPPIVERWPPQSRARYRVLRGEVLARLGRTAEALAALRDAVAEDPTNTNARVWLQALSLPSR